ncbi:unnamed protein product, partial [Polarella glacialis]
THRSSGFQATQHRPHNSACLPAQAATPPISGNCVWRRVVELQFAAGKFQTISAAAAFSELAGPAILAALAECLPAFTVKQGSPKHVHSSSQPSFAEIQAATSDRAKAATCAYLGGSTVRSVHAQAALLPEQRTLLLKLGFKLQDFAGQLRKPALVSMLRKTTDRVRCAQKAQGHEWSVLQSVHSSVARQPLFQFRINAFGSSNLAKFLADLSFQLASSKPCLLLQPSASGQLIAHGQKLAARAGFRPRRVALLHRDAAKQLAGSLTAGHRRRGVVAALSYARLASVHARYPRQHWQERVLTRQLLKFSRQPDMSGVFCKASTLQLPGPAISAALAECLPEFTVKQGSPKHVHSRSQASFVEIQAAMFDEAGADKQYCPKRPCSSSLTPSAADPSSEAGFQVGRLFRCPLTVLFKSGCGFLRIGTQASARQMRRAVGGTPAESTLAVSVEITHRSRTVLSACGHFLQVQFLRELDPSCRAATDSVSPVQSGMPLAQFLGLHVPCGAIQEAEKRSSLAHLQMPCSDRRHIATKTGQQKVCGASWCFPRRVVLHFGPSATPVRRELSSHCAGSCASLGLVSARKPLLLPIGASRIQQPTDKKMRAAFCKLTSKLSASSLEDLGLMELPSAHKKDMSVVRCGSFWPAAVDASREGRAELASKNTWQCISIVVAPALQHAWPATCRDVRFLEFLCGAVPRKPALPLLFFGVAHPIRAGQAADILERRLAPACPLGQLNAGEEDRHRGIVVSSASFLFQAPAIAGTSEASASWHKLAQQQQRNQFAQAGTSWHNRLCGLKLAALQQASSHSAWDAGSRCSSGKPQLGWVVATGFRREGTAASCGPATLSAAFRSIRGHFAGVHLYSSGADQPKKLTPAMTAITCGVDHSDLNRPLMQAACGDDTPYMSSPPSLPQRAQALQKPDFRQPDFQLLIQMSFAAHWKSGLHVTTRSEARCQGSARHARAEAPTDPAVSKLQTANSKQNKNN